MRQAYKLIIVLILLGLCVSGVQAYDSNLTKYNANLVLAAHMNDGGMVDDRGHDVIVNTATLDTDVKQLGAGSAKFTGTAASSNLSYAPSTDYDFGTDSNTVMVWVNTSGKVYLYANGNLLNSGGTSMAFDTNVSTMPLSISRYGFSTAELRISGSYEVAP